MTRNVIVQNKSPFSACADYIINNIKNPFKRNKYATSTAESGKVQQCQVSDTKMGKVIFGNDPRDADKSLFVRATRVIINHSIKNVVGYFIHDVGGKNSVHRRVLHSLLFLPLIAEPHSNHVLFKV